MTPEQILFETACNALHLEVTPDIANDIRQKGRDAITAAVAEEREACVKIVPTTWLDPILSGPGMKAPPFNGPDIERLLQLIAAAIRAREGKSGGQNI